MEKNIFEINDIIDLGLKNNNIKMSCFGNGNDIVLMGFEMDNYILVLKYKLFSKTAVL